MVHKFVHLKSSWGIVIFLDIVEHLEPDVHPNDIEVFPNCFLKINSGLKIEKEIISYWATRSILDLKESILMHIRDNKAISYEIVNLDFNYTDFQVEGLYYAIQGWFTKYYNFPSRPIKSIFSKMKNKYEFPDLKLKL